MAAVRKKQTSAKSNSRANEIIAIILAALAVLVFLCLFSYNPNDPTFNTASSQKTQNWIGIVGANFAEVLISLIGYAAYLLPFLTLIMVWRIFRAKDLRISLVQVFGYILLIVSLSSISKFLGFHGGIIGAFFFDRIFFALLGNIGSAVLLSAFILASFLVITHFSLISFIETLKIAFENFGIHFSEWLEKRSTRRAGVKSEKEKPDAFRQEKELKTMPTISTGDALPSAETKSVKIRDSVSNIFEDLKQKSAPAVEKSDIFQEEAPEGREEVSMPTISASDSVEPESKQKTPVAQVKKEPLPSSDLVLENENIPITPIQQTGELDAHLIEENKEEEVTTPLGQPQNFDNYILPTPDFLTPPAPRIEQKDSELLAIAQELTDKTKEFNVTGRVMHICQGPVVTTYEFKPDPGVKYSRVTSLVDDLCLALKAESIRIDRIPGKAFVGIEVPNRERETIHLREVIESKKFTESTSLLTIALGKTINGQNYVADLAKMPHLLIAGATGAGKSVGVNALVVSILYKAKPNEVKFIMVDPKRLELGVYADIPHLATPIITDPKRAAIALKWAVSEMERRYKDLAGWGVRNIDSYNEAVKQKNSIEQYDENGEPWKPLPYIVIIIDELADLMMVSGKEVEESITRLAQMARAVGIHLVLATQRPSVDVITGLIKANFPARISFRVSSKVDSRTIIDANGAERLLGRGDMLFLPPATSQLVRVHGAYVDEKEIHRIVEHIKAQGKPEYDTTITKTEEELEDGNDLPGKRDPLFWDAVRSVISAKRASTSLLQRHLRIGYGRAAAILDAMVREGYIGEMDGSTRARPVLQKAYDDLQDMEEMNS
jgi:S-DNA-T family DNA segregation ATPase FtsK/SpoIIIE